jgi:hypothetical protein
MRLAGISEGDYVTVSLEEPVSENISSAEDLRKAISALEAQMREAAKKFEFERAASLRDRMRALQQRQLSFFGDESESAAGAETAVISETVSAASGSNDNAVPPKQASARRRPKIAR